MMAQAKARDIEVVLGDITLQPVDALVNAANSALLPGGGVCGAIHRAAGPELAAECATLGGCPTGQARITRGYRLLAKWVIHAVGPVWHDGHHDEDELLALCYRACFTLAEEHGVESIAFPAISTGIYGFPRDRAARIAVRELRQGLASGRSVGRAVAVCFGRETLESYERAMREHDPGGR